VAHRVVAVHHAAPLAVQAAQDVGDVVREEPERVKTVLIRLILEETERQKRLIGDLRLEETERRLRRDLRLKKTD
jgi:hypothetical protein